VALRLVVFARGHAQDAASVRRDSASDAASVHRDLAQDAATVRAVPATAARVTAPAGQAGLCRAA
jgi:hypothetical protein